MPFTASALRVIRQTTPEGGWELATRTPHPRLQPYIHDFCGYVERTGGLLRRPEFVLPQVVVILEFGPPVRVYDYRDASQASGFQGGFVAGLVDQPALTEHDGFQAGMQMNLTPVGARLLFDRPASELTGHVVALHELLPAGARHLVETLHALPDWAARFDHLESVVGRCIEEAYCRRATLFDPIAWAAERIAASGGTLPIGELAQAAGISPRHFIHLFRQYVGVPPKLLARMVRFDRLATHLAAQPDAAAGSWADLALRFGYYDQSHLARDLRQFTGMTPAAAHRALTGEGPSLAAAERDSAGLQSAA